MHFPAPSAARGAEFRSRRRLRPLATALALACSGTDALAAPSTHIVTTCDDPVVLPLCDGHDDGTLRKALTCAGNNDVIDLTQLQCSKITLSGALVAREVSLDVIGPGQDKLTI